MVGGGDKLCREHWAAYSRGTNSDQLRNEGPQITYGDQNLPMTNKGVLHCLPLLLEACD